MKILLLLLLTVTQAHAFTPWPILSPADGTLTQKGSLITSDGVNQVPFLACANDQLIVWDSAEAGGFRCEAKPSGDTVVFTNGTDNSLFAESPGVDLSLPWLDTVINTNSTSNPIEIKVGAKMSMIGGLVGGTEGNVDILGCEFATFRNNVEIGTVSCNFSGRSTSSGYFATTCAMSNFIDFGASQNTATTYSFKLRLRFFGGSPFASLRCYLDGTVGNINVTAKQVN
jgi:hypothetical protein